MKFKIIFIIFNAIIVFSFLFIFFMPFLILGWDYTQVFWSNNWILAVIFLVIMGGLNAYFVSNWKLFTLLEAEDWNGLISYLEDKIYNKHRITKQNIRILVNTYVVTSRPEKITELEIFLRDERPKLVPAFAVQLGIPYLLRNEPVEMERYYGQIMKDPRCADLNWVKWNFGFALMLQQRVDEARDILLEILDGTKNDVLRVITAYLLDAFSNSDPTVGARVSEIRSLVRGKYDDEGWQKEVEKHRNNLQVLVLSKLIRDATNWLFEERENEVSAG
jgi:hypothetical protein